MANHPKQPSRQQQLLQLLPTDQWTLERLAHRLGSNIYTLRADLKRLEQRFPHRLHCGRDGHHMTYTWAGPLPQKLSQRLDYLDNDELIALVAARGLFRAPGHNGFDGPLDGAIDRLLQQLGLAEQSQHIDPRAIEVDRFAACPENPHDLVTALDAVLSGQALRGRYRNREDSASDVHLLPLRLLLIEGEFHCLGWLSPQRPVNDFRLSRFLTLASDHRLPPGAPARDDPRLLARIQQHRAASFRTHGHHAPQRRQRITLLLAAKAIPHLRDRCWGLDQEWQQDPPDQPPGCARLSFTTAGRPAALHWICSLGAAAIVESPEDLAQEVCQQARTMASYYGKNRRRRFPHAKG